MAVKPKDGTMNTQITFDRLPEAVALLLRKVEGIEQRLDTTASQSRPEQDELLTIAQAAQFLHLKSATIYGKVHRKELPFLKRSQRVYFSKSDLMAYLRQGRQETAIEQTQRKEAEADAALCQAINQRKKR